MFLRGSRGFVNLPFCWANGTRFALSITLGMQKLAPKESEENWKHLQERQVWYQALSFSSHDKQAYLLSEQGFAVKKPCGHAEQSTEFDRKFAFLGKYP